MIAMIMIGLLMIMPLMGMEKPKPNTGLQEKPSETMIAAYTNEDRESIISMIGALKYGHLLFPIADPIFKASLKHAVLDGKELMPEGRPQSLAAVVAAALNNLARIVKQTCPKKDFIVSLETVLDQIDDRYEEEAEPFLSCPDNIKASPMEPETIMRLVYAISHYEQFSQKDLRHMVELHKSAPEMLQDRLKAIPIETVHIGYEAFRKRAQGV